MIAKSSKRGISLLLAVLMCLTAFMGIGTTTAFAAGEVSEVYMIAFPRDGDENLDYDGSWGHEALQYMNGWSSGKSNHITVRAMGSSVGQICYCIEPGVSLHIGDTLTKWGEDFWENYPSDYNQTIEPFEIKQFIGRIMQYGYDGNISSEWRSQNEGSDKLAYAVATQLLIWEVVVGERDSDFNHVDTGSYDAVLDQIGEQNPLREKIYSYYDTIEANVQNHSKLPSFMKKTTGKARSIDLAWNGSEYTASVTDTNGVLGNYTFSGEGLSFSVNGNVLTISATEAPTEPVTITAEKANSQRSGVITWTDGHTGPGSSTLQDVSTFAEAVDDPIKGFLFVEVSAGSVKILKESEDGVVDGIPFRIQGEGVDQTVTTQNGGEIQVDNLRPGQYTITEQPPDRYEAQASQTVTVASGQTATVSFVNTLKRGDLKIIKTAEDGVVEGIPFVVTGNGITENVVTDVSGKIVLSGLLPGTYTVSEQSKSHYEPQASQTVTVTYGEVATVTFHNSLKRGDIRVIKSSEDSFVEGVKFHLYGTSFSGEVVDAYAVADASGVAVFKDIPIGSGYVLEEVETELKYIIPDSQTVTIEWDTVTEASFYNELKRGDIKVIKSSEDSFVEGVKFHLYGTALSGEKVDEYALTNADGVARFENILIGTGYTLEEVDTASKYIVPDSQAVNIEWNTVTQASFYNELKRGDLKVVKTAEDGLAEGALFRLYGMALSGGFVDLYAETDADGVAIFRDVLIGSDYTLEEVNTPSRYVVPASQEAAIEWNKVTEKSVSNILKKWQAEVVKKDSVAASAQGDATLEGAVYGVYKGGVLVDTYTTDADGHFITGYYPCYENVEWTIREVSPSAGYLLDPTVYPLDTSADLYTVERNSLYLDVHEDVILGKIAIIKHTDDGSTKIEIPEEGAVFEVYLKAAGSYSTAKPTERAILHCDEFGFAETADLPYGTYVVEQVEGWAGRELLPAFDVVITENGAVYKYLINNANFESYLHVVKTDSTTGKTIPYAGAGFQIYSPSGQLVTMTYTYPELTVIDTFYTNEQGSLLTPQKLPYGSGYSLVEVQAPHGYVLDSTPIYFDVTQENSSHEDGITIVKVVKGNEPQKGTISISKTGQVFASVEVTNDRYQPVYQVQGLAGAVYEITAAEDVITPDGTLRYSKGEVVATITTTADAKAVTESLFLGKFTIREVTAPYGMVINSETVTVELTYAGQEIAITTTETSFVNERQKVMLDLSKAMEQDENFGIGQNGEILRVVFGLYAAEDITAADGSFIPQDGLIETVTCAENGTAVFATDLPVGAKLYVKEIQTDSHYILSDEMYPMTFEYADQEVVLVEITANSGEPITNEIIRGSILGKKLDEDGNTIVGALFGLFRENETTFTEETAILAAESGEDGIFSFHDVPYGRWIVREIKAAPAFVLNENNYAITVSADGEVVEITIENEFIVGSATTTKVDAEYPENKLTGAVFEIYQDSDGNGEYNAEIDKLVGEMTESELGIYSIQDLRYGGYFLYEKAAPEGFKKDDGYHYFEIRSDGETVAVENEAGVGFVNQPITGELELTKTDISDGKLLPNVGFRIRNEAGEVVAEGYTDENGVAKFTLRYGKYTYEEFAPLAGYVPDENAYPFEIREDGEIVKATIINEKIPTPDIPQTGDNSNVGFWVGLAAVALGGLIATAIVLIKKKDDHK